MLRAAAIDLNQIPAYDLEDNPTGCCPRFHPEGWDEQELRFDNRPFVRVSTISAFHVPLNMGSVFRKTEEAIRREHADHGGFLVLSHDDSAWRAQHLFAVDRDVPGAEMVRLSGTFLTKVFAGPYAEAKRWSEEMERFVAQKGKHLDQLHFFFTTCPRCARAYGKNYVVGVAQVS